MSQDPVAIREFIITNFLFGDDSTMPGDSESLVDAGVVDSTGILELIEFIESNYAITIADAETIPENLDSVERIAGFVERKLAG